MRRRNLRLWQSASRCLAAYRSDAMLLGSARLAVTALCLLTGIFIQRSLKGYQPALPGVLLLTLIAAAPMRTETVRHLGCLTGVLNEDDRGFLNCSSRFWLWKRAVMLRLFCGILFFCACIPFLLLFAAARVTWLVMPADGEDLLPLLTVLHCLMLLPAAAGLPLRVFAAGTALPFVLLKMPEYPAAKQLRLAFRLTRGQTAEIILQRVMCLPALILPYPAVLILPTLLSTELFRCQRCLKQ